MRANEHSSPFAGHKNAASVWAVATETSRRAPRWLVICAATLLVSPSPSFGAEAGQQIVYYDPDANYQAMPDILSWLGKHLAQTEGGFRVSAVPDASALEAEVRKSAAPFVIVASAYLMNSSKLNLTPLLIPKAAAGDEFYRKILLTRASKATGPRTLGQVATAGGVGSAASKKALASAIRKGNVRVEATAFMRVSKDIDALLALAFGQVDGALVTPTSLELLRTINPAAAQSFQTIWTSDPILRPLLCQVGKRADVKQVKAVRLAFLSMGSTVDGRKAMQTMGIGEWIAIRAPIMEKLK